MISNLPVVFVTGVQVYIGTDTIFVSQNFAQKTDCWSTFAAALSIIPDYAY
jgi:hypothetical protein